ncbi:MAG: hypothetical protein NZ961_04115 [Candidatus Poribacteria bacterium]|nr:hypothetical protein [Candidatus Poribacteria bacterium]
MPKFEETNIQLSAYFDGEISRQNQLRVRRHLENSAEDAFELMQIAQVDHLLRQLGPIETTDQFLLELMQRVSEIPPQEEPPLALFSRYTKKFQSWFVFLCDQSCLKFHSVTFGIAVFVLICVSIFFLQTRPIPQEVNVPLVARSVDRFIQVDLVSMPITEKQSIISPIHIEGEK